MLAIWYYVFLPISKCNSLHISDVMMCADKSASTNPLCLWSDYSGSEERSEEREENYFNFQPKKALTLPFTIFFPHHLFMFKASVTSGLDPELPRVPWLLWDTWELGFAS